MQDYRGLFIKKYRKEKEYSLEALAHGICSVSYLSKIENNEVLASDEIINLLMKKLKIAILDEAEVKDVKRLLDLFFKKLFDYDPKVVEVSKQLEQYENKVDGSSVYIYYQLYVVFSREFCHSKLNSKIDLENYLSYMNEKEKALFHVYQVCIQKEEYAFKDEKMELFILKGQAAFEIKKQHIFKAYDLLTKAYIQALNQCKLIYACDILLDLGWISYPNVEQVSKYYFKVIEISKKYLSKDERNMYMSIIYNNLSTLCFINEQYKVAKQYFDKGLKYVDYMDIDTKNRFLKRSEYCKNLLQNQCEFDKKQYDFIKDELRQNPKDIFLHDIFKKVCVASLHWKEAYEQELYFSQ